MRTVTCMGRGRNPCWIMWAAATGSSPQSHCNGVTLTLISISFFMHKTQCQDEFRSLSGRTQILKAAVGKIIKNQYFQKRGGSDNLVRGGGKQIWSQKNPKIGQGRGPKTIGKKFKKPYSSMIGINQRENCGGEGLYWFEVHLAQTFSNWSLGIF